MVLMFSRITDQRHEKLPYFVFGDFNFRLDSKQVIEVSVSLLKPNCSHNLCNTGTFVHNCTLIYTQQTRLSLTVI